MITNNLSTQQNQERPTFSTFLVNKKKSIIPILGEDAATRFIAAITAAVSNNPTLAGCDYFSLLSGALLGESLKLAHSPALGQYYLVPFADKSSAFPKAQFMLGVKGWKQLALRSGQYEKIIAIEVKQGELLGLDPFTAEPKIRFISDFELRNSLPVIGYYAYFRLLNGYSQALYWSYDFALAHADRYSKAFSKDAVNTDKMQKVSYADYKLGKYPKKDEWKYSSFWYKNFDEMACGKVLKKLLSDGAPLSFEIQNAINADSHVISMSDDNSFEYNQGETLSDVIVDDVPMSDQADFKPQTQDEQATIQEEKKTATRAKRTAQTSNKKDVEDIENEFFS